MISVITCVSDTHQYNTFCLPTLLQTSEQLKAQGIPELDIIRVSHPTSIYSAYNDASSKAKYRTKVFMHQDVNLMDTSWLNKVVAAFTMDEKIGMVGFVGTRKLADKGFWWESGGQYITGQLYSGQESANWIFDNQSFMTEVECLDGFFLAINRDFTWDESLTGFHFYDMDASRSMRADGYKLAQVDHKAWHIGAIRNQDLTELWKPYNKKWGLE